MKELSLNSYINHTLRLYNQLNQRHILKTKLARESKAVAHVSLEILFEMEKIADGLGHEDSVHFNG